MKHPKPHRSHRRGAIAPLAALLFTFVVGMVAFAVDIGWLATTRAELQNAADAAALAGAQPLMDGSVQYAMAPDSPTKATVLSAVLATARANAKQYAGYNAAGEVPSLVLNDSDIEFGFIDGKNNYTALPTYTGFPNTIKVLLRRDSQANQPVSLFFGKIWGASATDMQATASATIYTGTINSFSGSAGLLPLTFDVNLWNNFMQTGQSPDGTTVKDKNGITEIQAYPTTKYKGNFGQLSLNDSSVGDNTEVAWVTNGMSANDLQALLSNHLLPLSQHPANTWDWQGSTGMKGNLIQTVNNYVGQTFVLPLFNPVNSDPANYQAGINQGTNYSYDVVQMVGVRIMPASKNNQIIIQPAAVIIPNAILDPTTIVPAGTTSQVVTTFTTPKLTR